MPLYECIFLFFSSGGWGYFAKFKEVEADLLGEFPQQLRITGKKDVAYTGAFEVQIEGGKLAWSKKHCGQFPKNIKDMKQIYAAVREALANQNGKAWAAPTRQLLFIELN